MSIKNKDFVYGDVEFDDDELEPRCVKIRITTLLDEDVLDGLKKIAKQHGQKYQTILNQILRAFVEGKKNRRSPGRGRKVKSVGEERVREIVREEIKKRA